MFGLLPLYAMPRLAVAFFLVPPIVMMLSIVGMCDIFGPRMACCYFAFISYVSCMCGECVCVCLLMDGRIGQGCPVLVFSFLFSSVSMALLLAQRPKTHPSSPPLPLPFQRKKKAFIFVHFLSLHVLWVRTLSHSHTLCTNYVICACVICNMGEPFKTKLNPH